jgi:hypothetical protein
LPLFSQNEQKSGQACRSHPVFKEPNASSIGRAIFVPLIQEDTKSKESDCGYGCRGPFLSHEHSGED